MFGLKQVIDKDVVSESNINPTEEALTPQGGTEEPDPGRRSVPESVAWVPSVAGLIIAGEIVKELCGIEW